MKNKKAKKIVLTDCNVYICIEGKGELKWFIL